jgi:hypothetical protein
MNETCQRARPERCHVDERTWEETGGTMGREKEIYTLVVKLLTYKQNTEG